MSFIEAQITGLDVTVNSLRGFPARAKAYAFTAVLDGLKIARDEAAKLISASDHSLKELAEMGHPYAAAHPAPPHSDPIVHVQTGAYLAALTVTPPVGYSGDIVEGKVSIEGDEQMKLLDRWIQEGTITMVGRAYFAKVIETAGPDISKRMQMMIKRALDRDAGRSV